MRFLVDAQLPRRMAHWFVEMGHDAVHTLDLPLGNRTPDSEIVAVAMREQRVVVTKDDDFVRSFLLSGEPSALLLIATGNISNLELEKIMRINMARIEMALTAHCFVELQRDNLVVHA